MEELIKRVKASEATKAVWRKNSNSNEWKEASKLNQILTGMPLNRSAHCECIEDLFFLLKRENVEQKIFEKMEKKFFLKPGKLIQSADMANIGESSSDELMIKALKRSPGLIKHFKTYPDNWKEICGIEEPTNTEAGNDTTVDPVFVERKERIAPFVDFADETKMANFYSLTQDEFEAMLTEAENAFNEEQEKQLLEPATEGNTADVNVNNEENKTVNVEAGDDKTANIQGKFTFEDLDKLKVSGLREILAKNKVEIPANVSRKAELIEFILKTL